MELALAENLFILAKAEDVSIIYLQLKLESIEKSATNTVPLNKIKPVSFIQSLINQSIKNSQ